MLKPKERISSMSMQEYFLRLCSQGSYRASCELLNAVFHRLDGDSFKLRTLADAVDAAGRRIREELDSRCREALKENCFDSETALAEDAASIPASISAPSSAEGASLPGQAVRFDPYIEQYNSDKNSACQIKDDGLINKVEPDPANCVYVSIDDVGVKHQKDSRKNGGDKYSRNVENTVIHVQAAEGSYVLTAVGMDHAFRLLVAFLLGNRLLENRYLYFFSDGASNIRKGIETYFSFCPSVHMLDWYHLEKRMTELLSMALKGKKEDRHEIRYILDGMLWAGNIDDAIHYIQSMDKKNIKNSSKLQEAVDYLERKRPYIGCYALRKLLGYRNSSNPAEKSNDILVARRQKHNGMSWSYSGSNTLALISSLIRNGELHDWVSKGTVRFSLQDDGELCAA